MSIMIEALKRAGLISKEKAEQAKKVKTKKESIETHNIRYQQWKSRSVKNKYGDVALFEIWEKTGQYPKNHRRKCCMCGKTISTDGSQSIEWRAPNGKFYRMCNECYMEGREDVDNR